MSPELYLNLSHLPWSLKLNSVPVSNSWTVRLHNTRALASSYLPAWAVFTLGSPRGQGRLGTMRRFKLNSVPVTNRYAVRLHITRALAVMLFMLCV